MLPPRWRIVSFNDANGQFPNGGLITDAAGDLFGTTYQGGATGLGTVFELLNNGVTYALTTLANFSGADSGGWWPDAGLIADAAGDLFGTTSNGGAYGDGVLFEITDSGGSYASTPTTLVSFNSTTENPSFGTLIADGAGDFFGTATGGGPGGDYGTAFEIENNGGRYALISLVSFNGADGAYPYNGLIADAAGDLFGTTYNTHVGGVDGDGTVFEIPYINGSYASTPTTLVSFTGTDEDGPIGSLITDAAGNLFGTTNGGGANGDGTVFELPYIDGGYAGTPMILAEFQRHERAAT